ncbi:hypothetical protein BDW75DRAFT_217761 [Aspergillus navahoensis]
MYASGCRLPAVPPLQQQEHPPRVSLPLHPFNPGWSLPAATSSCQQRQLLRHCSRPRYRTNNLQLESFNPKHPFNYAISSIYAVSRTTQAHTSIGCGKQGGFPSAQPYLVHYCQRG